MNALDTSALRTAYNQKLAQMSVMDQSVIDTGTPFTDEQQNQYDNLEKEVDQLQSDIARIEKTNQRLAQLQNPAPNNTMANNPSGSAVPTPQNQGGNNNPQQPNPTGAPGSSTVPGAQNQSPAKGPRINVNDPNFVQDPKCGFFDHREFFEAVMNYGKRVEGRIANFKDNRIDYLASVNVARRDNALMSQGGFINDCDAGADGTTASTGDLTGSVFVPMEFSPEILKVGTDVPTGAFQTSRRNMSSMQLERRYRLDKDHRTSVTGGFVVGRNYEHCCLTSSAAQYTKYYLQVYPLYGAYVASDQLIEQNPQVIIDEVEEGFRTEFDAHRVVEILNGTGQGEYKGIWKSALVEVTLAGADLAPKDIYTMGERLWRGPTANRNRIVWVAGLNYASKLKLLQDATTTSYNHFLFQPNAGPEWADGMLDGYPIIFTEFAPNFGFRGSLGLYQMSEYEEGTWRPLRMASSMHARFLCNEQAMKFWTYTGGQSRWASTMIPKTHQGDAGDFNISPFVLLAGSATAAPTPNRPHNKKSS